MQVEIGLMAIAIAVWAVSALATTLTVIIIRTRQVRNDVKTGVDGLEKRVDDGLSAIESSTTARLSQFEAKIDVALGRLDDKVQAIEIPQIPANLEETLNEIYEAIPGEEDQDVLVERILSDLGQKLNSMEAVKQKALYEYLNQAEEGFKALDGEHQASLISQMDIYSSALQEIASIKMSPTQAKKTPFMAAGLNIGKIGLTNIIQGLAQQKAFQNPGRVTIESSGGSGSYNPGFPG